MASLMAWRSINDARDAFGEFAGVRAVLNSDRTREPCDGSLQSILLAAADLVLTCLPEDLPHRSNDGGRFSTGTYDLPFGPNGQCSCIPRAFLMNASAQRFDGFASTRVSLRMRGVHLDQ